MAYTHITLASTVSLLLCAALQVHAQTPAPGPVTPQLPAASAPAQPTAAGAPATPEQSPAPGIPAVPAAATPTAPAEIAPPPAAVTAAPIPPPVAATKNDASARLVLRTLAERERSGRFASAYSMFLSGAAAITAGIIADAVYDRYYGKPLWIIGAFIEVGGVMNLLRSGTFERLADVADSYSAEQLKREWSQRALFMRTGRKIGGVVSLVLGALTIGTGAAIAAGLGELKREAKQDWTTALIATGGGIIGSGVVSLLVESPLESSYRAAYGTDPDGNNPVNVSVAPTIGGAALHLSAKF